MGRFFGRKIERTFLNAAKKGNLARIKSLLDNNRGLDLDNIKTSIFGKRPLHLAAGNDHAQVVEFLLAKGANVDATEREMTFTPLHLAAREGHTQIAELLLSEGADINAQNTNGNNPLWEAVFFGRIRMVEVLIAKGADVNTKNSDGTPVLFLASSALPGGSKPRTDRYGFSRPLYYDTLGDQKHRKEIAELLITEGANVDAKGPIGFTPLHVAADSDCKDVVELLLDKGADVDAKAFDSSTPLHVAAQNGHKDVVELLLDKGADVNARVNSKLPSLVGGATPLWLAKDGGHEEIAELLRNRGAIE